MIFLKANIISNELDLLPFNAISTTEGMERIDKQSAALLEVARLSEGMSGRTLRKMPFLAHAWFIRSEQVTFQEYLGALRLAVVKHRSDSKNI